MNWAEFFQIITNFIMQLVAFFKSSDKTTNKPTEQ